MNARALSLTLAATLAACGSGRSVGYHVDDLGHKVVVELDGEIFTEYRYRHDSRPILYPLMGPSGVNVTRHYPLLEGMPGESADHPHHESLWFAHGNVNGYDFWHGTDAGERIIHDRVVEARKRTEGKRAMIRTRNLWIVGDRTLCTEERSMVFDSDERGRIIDFTIELAPTDQPLVFGDTKEGTFALRLAPQLRLEGEVAAGHCLNSADQRDGDCWGKRASWMAYWGPLGEETVSVAILDHPDNPGHPTYWHARDYGLFAANPFGVHDFEDKPAGTGDLRVELGESVTFRYRLRLDHGPANAGVLDRELRIYGDLPPF